MMQENCLDTDSHQECMGFQLAVEQISKTMAMGVVVGLVTIVALGVMATLKL
ncbi:hypothetical protein AXX17_AT1G50040 [Arabidopsis thaliana]|uniref:Uncharacterized protein n=1 Tax=Arabidopsis thaliana TaxID=3702 RepID=A0A178WG07_ARATH|nr:hypothetical protein AXX17_AT1G50040 [Arabidopsis thaliana]